MEMIQLAATRSIMSPESIQNCWSGGSCSQHPDFLDQMRDDMYIGEENAQICK
jgi:hypothetical protein